MEQVPILLRVLVMSVPVVLSYLGKDYLRGKEKYYNIIVNFSVTKFNSYFIGYKILDLCKI